MNFEDYESLPTTNVQSHMVAGAAAGVMEHCVMYPLDSVKTRMQSLTASSSELGRGMGDVFRGMVAQEGVMRPLRGVNAVILGAAPAHALYFSCYEFLKENFTNKTLINNNVGYGLAGGIATMLHDGIMTPADVVKQRLQMYNSPYRSVLETIRTIYTTEGLVAFYRSYTTQLAMNVPFQSIHFIMCKDRNQQIYQHPHQDGNTTICEQYKRILRYYGRIHINKTVYGERNIMSRDKCR
uniref:Mitoferrin-1 n=1 Tax=Cacopsylla melanoneura TaxID=428564 RepID=A0A8D9AI62_9HEMI